MNFLKSVISDDAQNKQINTLAKRAIQLGALAGLAECVQLTVNSNNRRTSEQQRTETQKKCVCVCSSIKTREFNANVCIQFDFRSTLYIERERRMAMISYIYTINKSFELVYCLVVPRIQGSNTYGLYYYYYDTIYTIYIKYNIHTVYRIMSIYSVYYTRFLCYVGRHIVSLEGVCATTIDYV